MPPLPGPVPPPIDRTLLETLQNSDQISHLRLAIELLRAQIQTAQQAQARQSNNSVSRLLSRYGITPACLNRKNLTSAEHKQYNPEMSPR